MLESNWSKAAAIGGAAVAGGIAGYFGGKYIAERHTEEAMKAAANAAVQATRGQSRETFSQLTGGAAQ